MLLRGTAITISRDNVPQSRSWMSVVLQIISPSMTIMTVTPLTACA